MRYFYTVWSLVDAGGNRNYVTQKLKSASVNIEAWAEYMTKERSFGKDLVKDSYLLLNFVEITKNEFYNMPDEGGADDSDKKLDELYQFVVNNIISKETFKKLVREIFSNYYNARNI